MPTRPNLPKPDRRRWHARALATAAADLAVRVDPADATSTIDVLLATCLHDDNGHAPTPAEAGSWTVADRLDALLDIHLAAGDDSHVLALRCADPDCGADFEAELDLTACRRPHPVADRFDFTVGDREFRARLPTGAEQSRWRRQATPLHVVAAALIESSDGAPPILDAAGSAGAPRSAAGEPVVVVEASDVPESSDRVGAPALTAVHCGRFAPDAATLAALDDALAAHDAVRTLRLNLVCPTCGVGHRHTVELETLLLTSLAERQATWLNEIATIAGALHWSESSIADMPAWRRAHYLRRIAPTATLDDAWVR